MLTSQRTIALLKQAGLVYHQRDERHRVIQRGLEVSQPSRQRGVVLIEFAFSLAEWREVGDEQIDIERKQALVKATEALKAAGLRAEYSETKGMVLAAGPGPMRK